MAAFLDEQDGTSVFSEINAFSRAKEEERDMLRLQSLIEDIQQFPIDDTPVNVRHPRMPSTQYKKETSLLPGFELPAYIDPRELLTPTESVHVPSEPLHESKICISRHAWQDISEKLDCLREQNKQLQEQVSALEQYNVFGQDNEASTQVGLLRYQNEANRTQKADMGRSLAQKAFENKKKEIEIADLKKRLSEAETIHKDHDRIVATRDHEIEKQRVGICQMEDAFDNKTMECEAAMQALQCMTVERDAAISAQTNAGDHKNRAQSLAETMMKREMMINDLKHKCFEEQRKVANLENENNSLKLKMNQENIDDLKQKLYEKSSLCDRQRNELRIAQHNLTLSQERIKRLSNNGDILRGGAHLVKPALGSRLSTTVIGCSECYAKNIPCDNRAQCRNCTENNTPCARWRCSMVHKLGHCEDVPCKIPHDSQGWLVLHEDRPQW